MEKLCINERKIPTEFLTYIIQRGITELNLFECEILPPKVPEVDQVDTTNELTTLILDKTLISEILPSLFVSLKLEKMEIKKQECSNCLKFL